MSAFPVRNLLLLGLVGLAMLAVALAACGGDEANQASPTAAAESPAEVKMELTDLEGLIEIDGSSTVYPVTEAMAEVFGEMTDGNVRVVVGISGTGGGFKKFCGGETAISDASRPIKQSEIDLCADSGTDYVEIPVAVDGLSVLVNTENDFVDCMTVDELNTVWAPEAEDVVKKWSQVRAGWPDEDLRLYAPGTDSGTFDYFTETVNGESQASRGDGIFSEDDNVLVTGISRDRGALGYFGLRLLRREQRHPQGRRHRRRRRRRLHHPYIRDDQQRNVQPVVPPAVHLRPGRCSERAPHQGVHQILPRQRFPESRQ